MSVFIILSLGVRQGPSLLWSGPSPCSETDPGEIDLIGTHQSCLVIQSEPRGDAEGLDGIDLSSLHDLVSDQESRPDWLVPTHIVKTTRNCALPLIMRA